MGNSDYKYEFILVDHGRVSTVTFNRPEVGNAMTLAMEEELSDALHRLDRDEDVRAIVLTGAGKMFCAGQDLANAEATWSNQEAWADGGADVDMRKLRTPVICAINGSAAGAGMALAMLCDIRIVADDAKLGFVFARRGIVADGTLHWWLPRLIGTSRALELLLTGRLISGSDAELYGVVSRALPKADVLPAAHVIADEIARMTSPVSVGLMKGLVYEGMSQPQESAADDREWEIFKWAGKQPDAGEGVVSFLERREPVWKGKKIDIDQSPFALKPLAD
jgi:enoyl-CoA hydratase/carnithine racemase